MIFHNFVSKARLDLGTAVYDKMLAPDVKISPAIC